MLWGGHSALTLCCRYKTTDEGIKLDVEECGEVLMAAWGVMDSSRVQQGEGFIAPQLQAASSWHSDLGENLSVHSKVWLLLNFGRASRSRTLYLCARTRHIEGMKSLIDQSSSCFCTSSCFGCLIALFCFVFCFVWFWVFWLLLCFSIPVCGWAMISLSLWEKNPQMHKGQDFHLKISRRRHQPKSRGRVIGSHNCPC